MRLRWKKSKEPTGLLGAAGQEHRLRRGDLTLAVVAPAYGSHWYFRGRVPGGVAVNTLTRPTSGEEGPRTWPDLEGAKEAAADWVDAEERRVAAAREAQPETGRA